MVRLLLAVSSIYEYLTETPVTKAEIKFKKNIAG